MKKQILVLMLVFTMVVAFVPCIHAATIVDSGECGAQGDNLTWTLDSDGTLTISGTGDMADYPFKYSPSSDKHALGHMRATQPWLYFYSQDKTLKKIVIKEGVTSIGEFAFYAQHDLESVEIPDNIIKISDSAFDNCGNLKSVRIGDGVQSMGAGAFANCDDLTEINIGSGITEISSAAFSECTSLKRIVIPDGITKIDEYAFRDCSNLTNIVIPENVTEIVVSAFEGCRSLESINVDSNNPVYSSEDGVLFNKDKTELIIYPHGRNGEYTIPDSVTRICDSAFAPYSMDGLAEAQYDDETSPWGLTSIIIPDSVTDIGSEAFRGCFGLTSVEIPDSVTSLGDCAFDYCVNLKSAIIGKGIKNLSVFDFVTFLKDAPPIDIYYRGSEDELSFSRGTRTTSAPEYWNIHYNSGIYVTLDGKKIQFDVPAQIISDRTLVPLRAIFEALGATVDWDSSTQTVTSSKNNTVIKVTIGNNIMKKNNENIELDVPAQIISDRTLVPARAVAEAFGCNVDWDSETKTVIITQ